MHIETQRILVLPNPPAEVWRLLSDPTRLPVFAPEVMDCYAVAGGLLRIIGRVGTRRRAWRAKATLDPEKQHLVLESATEGLTFSLDAVVTPQGEGSQVKVSLTLAPPEVWKAHPRPGGIPRRVVQRLLLSFALFALSAGGVMQLPSLGLSRWPETVAYAFVGAFFVIGAALLTSARGPIRQRRRRTDAKL